MRISALVLLSVLVSAAAAAPQDYGLLQSKSDAERLLAQKRNLPKAPLTLTHVANMGVLVESGGTKVLIDALFDKPHPEYRAPAPVTLEKVIRGDPPYDGVKLALITHNHPDHLAPSVAVRFLEAQTEAMLIAPADAVAEMKKVSTDWQKVAPRVIAIDLPVGGSRRLEPAGTPVTVVRTLHSGDGESPMNLMYFFEIGGRRVFHEGDSNGKPDVFKGFGLEAAPVDLAVVHFWFPLEPNMSKYLQETFQPDHIALGHLPIRLESDAPKKIDMVRTYYKNIFLLLPGMPDIIMKPAAPQDILRAVRNGDLEMVQSLLEDNPELIRTKDEYKNSLLCLALLKNDFRLARFLIESGIDVNYARQDTGGNEIFGAIGVNSLEITKLIYERGADIHSAKQWWNTPLEAAVLEGRREIAYFLMDKGAVLNVGSRNLARLLRAALSAGMDRITNRLIKEKEVDLKNVDGLGNTLLHAAAGSGDTAFIGLLVDNGVDPNAGNIYGWTPLHLAASLGHQSMIEALLDRGADKRIRTKDGRTPFNLAEASGRNGLAAALKEKGFPAAPPEFPKISARYVDPALPQADPVRFATGIVSQPHHFEHSKLTFTADMKTACWSDWQRRGVSKVFIMENRDGTVYFAHDADIYRSRPVDGRYGPKEKLPPPINDETTQAQPFVDPDGSLLLFRSIGQGGVMEEVTGTVKKQGDALEAEKRKIAETIGNVIGWAKTKDLDLFYGSIANDEDYISVTPGARVIKRFEDVKQNVPFWMSPDFAYVRHELKDLEITFARCGTVAWFFCILDDINTFKGEPANWENARWTGVVEKRDGKWIVVSQHFSFAKTD